MTYSRLALTARCFAKAPLALAATLSFGDRGALGHVEGDRRGVGELRRRRDAEEGDEEATRGRWLGAVGPGGFSPRAASERTTAGACSKNEPDDDDDDDDDDDASTRFGRVRARSRVVWCVELGEPLDEDGREDEGFAPRASVRGTNERGHESARASVRVVVGWCGAMASGDAGRASAHCVCVSAPRFASRRGPAATAGRFVSALRTVLGGCRRRA